MSVTSNTPAVQSAPGATLYGMYLLALGAAVIGNPPFASARRRAGCRKREKPSSRPSRFCRWYSPL